MGTHPHFIDVFAGCGGLSLGLANAGWRGLFAVEKDAFAFSSLKANLIDRKLTSVFDWPDWLPKEKISISDLLKNHQAELRQLTGRVDLISGGPPCQGYSSAGSRRQKDPRNRLFLEYLELIEIVRPQYVLMENVRGMTVSFASRNKEVNYADELETELSKQYKVHTKILDVSTFGVPQRRTRFVVIGGPKSELGNPFDMLEERRAAFLTSKSLINKVSSRQAISDLEVVLNGTSATDTPRFRKIAYSRPRTTYQRLMNKDSSEVSDTRLANHSPAIVQRFAEIMKLCQIEGRLNTSISAATRKEYGLKKRALRVLDPDRPAPTVTSMPDDLLHYSEPRTLTVRENARLQSFPDWFQFLGKTTTGGLLRRKEVPRFTQVANAVPPLLAEALGLLLGSLCETRNSMPQAASPSFDSKTARSA